ncbi:MAG: hypothetical protein GWN01_00240, partial [Nitrosopumilaceae archaeon]|nr:hypothetical protein [Nitrosopumilaceae archaeon]NIX60016.1 hypothetical protein [Nitrosopumilaceae archaeon]
MINDAEMNPYLNNETAENKSLDTAVDSSSTNDNDADDSDYDSIDTGDSAADQGSQKNSIDFTDSTIQLASFVVDDNNNDDDAPTKETEGKV